MTQNSERFRLFWLLLAGILVCSWFLGGRALGTSAQEPPAQGIVCEWESWLRSVGWQWIEEVLENRIPINSDS